ncbi:MAG TPA: tetratricopeptide repeat protein, partial [Promineifilum sp.]|nr:tetratricopeptide repeat protein [Promineifilum sp.]
MNLPDAGRLPELTALTVRSAPYLLTRIGREAEYRALVGTLQETVRTRHGRTVCLLGHTGCGRRALMADVQKSALSLGYRLATIRFEDLEEAQPGHVRVHWGDLAGRAARQFVAETFPRTAKETGGEWADLMRQLADEGTFAYVGQSSAADDPRALNKLIRAAGNRDPLLVCVENLDAAQNLWIDLLHDLALQEIPRDLPVVLLIGMDAPQPLAELRGPRHSERTRLAQKLVRDGVADAFFLGPITAADIRAWTGPADPELTERLAHLSDFDPKVVETLWLEWKTRGVAVPEPGGRWVVAAGARQWVAGDMRDHALALLSAALEGYEDDMPYTAAQVEHILACAALEGEVFHAEAVARVLELDADELIDFFDTYLTAGEPDNVIDEAEDAVEEDDEEDTAADGWPSEPLLEEAGFYKMALQVYVNGQPTAQYLHLYRFARPYLHLVWERYGPPEAKRKAWPLALANALEALYDPFAMRIAGKLIRLFAAAGADSRAAQYHRLRTGRLTLAQLRWHLDALLAEPTEDKYALSRLFEAAIPFLNRWAREQPGEWPVGLDYALQVASRAEALDDEENQAEAWYYAAWMHYNGAGYAAGVGLARRALAIQERVCGENHLATAASLSILGMLLQAQGDLAGARPYYERALAIAERVLGPEHPQTAAAVNNLAGLLQDQGDLAGA